MTGEEMYQEALAKCATLEDAKRLLEGQHAALALARRELDAYRQDYEQASRSLDRYRTFFGRVNVLVDEMKGVPTADFSNLVEE